MTVQEVKEKLGSVYVRYREYMLAEEKAEQFRDMISLPAPVEASDTPRSESGGNSTESKYIAALWYSEQADRKFREYMIARQSAEMMIGSVRSPDEREVLARRYIMFQKWEQIAERMYISQRNVYYLHGSGLKKISESLQ
jgi:DNA-directed RNA polymerase specialized sigma subunit